ncbi:hypothetical protein K7432_003514 [Basidiobolus ranarum]|uniref:Enoyl reductase (ER) domain-containing protein n=1 Tax=Basidiobolus ranarum TaxID=34480 RepID=A0ABR2WZW5_9FUNG
MSMKAIQIQKTGGVEVLNYTDVSIPKPSKNELLVKNHAIGVNYIDTYHRTGLYTLPLPLILGREGAGIVEAVGEQVTDFKVGDRVAYVAAGSYAEYGLSQEDKTAKLPESVDYDVGAASLLQGLTALSLAKESYKVKPDDWILVHAAAGGVGLLFTQLCKHFGANVIGTTSTPEKAEIARKAGADHVINYTKDDVVAEVKKITDGKGVHAVFDGVGKQTFDISLASLRRCGTLVSYGNASGKVDNFDISRLSVGNYKLLRPTLFNYIVTKEEFQPLVDELFDLIGNKKLNIKIFQTYPLKDAAQAHQDLEGRKTTGKLILKP